jgi:DNA-binding response OmpR family regulator
MATILLLEDDPDLRESVASALAEAGYGVLAARSLAEAESLVRQHSFDLALLDVNVPASDSDSVSFRASDSGSVSPQGNSDGFSFCRWLTARRHVAVCFLSARDLEEDVLTGYTLGACDYVTKPFSMKVLLAKLAVLLGRAPQQALVVDDGWLRIDFDLGSVMRAGEAVRLSPTELKLLRVLVDHRGQLLTYGVLLDALWNVGVELVDKHALAVNVNRLRKKIEDDAHSYIANVYGMGYLWK